MKTKEVIATLKQILRNYKELEKRIEDLEKRLVITPINPFFGKTEFPPDDSKNKIFCNKVIAL